MPGTSAWDRRLDAALLILTSPCRQASAPPGFQAPLRRGGSGALQNRNSCGASIPQPAAIALGEAARRYCIRLLISTSTYTLATVPAKISWRRDGFWTVTAATTKNPAIAAFHSHQ